MCWKIGGCYGNLCLLSIVITTFITLFIGGELIYLSANVVPFCPSYNNSVGITLGCCDCQSGSKHCEAACASPVIVLLLLQSNIF